MAATIIEALENAKFNLDNIPAVGNGIIPLIREQIGNAIALLEKGYSIHAEVETLIDEHGGIEFVPECK